MSSTLGHNTAQYVAKVLPILFRELRCEDGGNRRNAAFCAGVFCQHAPEQMQAQLGQLLQVFLFATPFKKPLGNLWETFGRMRRTRLVFAYQFLSVRVSQPPYCLPFPATLAAIFGILFVVYQWQNFCCSRHICAGLVIEVAADLFCIAKCSLFTSK